MVCVLLKRALLLLGVAFTVKDCQPTVAAGPSESINNAKSNRLAQDWRGQGQILAIGETAVPPAVNCPLIRQ